MRTRFSLAALVCLANCAAAAETPVCATYQMDPDQATLAKVTARRAYFVRGDEREGCPSLRADCRDKAYVVAGDALVITATRAGLSCVAYADAKGGGRLGWMASAAITAFDAPTQPLAAWQGQWRAPEQRIDIGPAPRTGHLRVIGDATWGASDPERVARGGVNVGDIAGDVVPVDGRAGFAIGGPDAKGVAVKGSLGEDVISIPYEAGGENDCRVALRLLGPYLLAKDNNLCGGMNVSFSGVYGRLSPSVQAKPRP